MEIWVDGGSLGQIYGEGDIGGNTTILVRGEPEFRYGIFGNKGTDTAEKSVLNFDGAVCSIPRVGWLTAASLYNGADVTITGVDACGDTHVDAFYSSNNSLSITENSKLHTCVQTQIKGKTYMENGTFIGDGKTYFYQETETKNSTLIFNNYIAIGYGYKDNPQGRVVFHSVNDDVTFHRSSSSDSADRVYGSAQIEGGTWTLWRPVRVEENYSGTGNTLNLPAFLAGENYPDKLIPLAIAGSASGDTDVYLVQTGDATVEGQPVIGHNYINALKISDKTFTLANQNAKQQGYYFRRVDDAQKDPALYDMWQVAGGIFISPGDITIYVGGQGYEGAVDANGNAISTVNGFPTPGFLISGITNFDYTKAVLRYDNGQGDVREWQILPYDEKPDHRVYRFEPANTVSGTNVRMQFIRDDGTVATEDSFLIADRLDEKLTMKVYGEGIDENYVTLVYDGTAYGIISGTGELTVRSTASPTFFTITDDSGSILPEMPGASAPSTTVYTINESSIQANASKVALLFDNIIETGNNYALMQARVDKVLADAGIILGAGGHSYEMRYLDLVDTSNGNTWVKADQLVTVYWPLPEGAEPNATYALLHFEGLDREMSVDEVSGAIGNCSVTLVDYRIEGNHIAFTPESGGFSPFVLAWGAPPAPGPGGETWDDGDSGEYLVFDQEGIAGQDSVELPPTGDAGTPMLWLAAAACSLLGLIIAGIKRHGAISKK